MRTRHKNCHMCKKEQMVLYRCKFNDCLSWYFLCKSCLDYVKKNMVKTTYMVALGKVKKIIRISIITKININLLAKFIF